MDNQGHDVSHSVVCIRPCSVSLYTGSGSARAVGAFCIGFWDVALDTQYLSVQMFQQAPDLHSVLCHSFCAMNFACDIVFVFDRIDRICSTVSIVSVVGFDRIDRICSSCGLLQGQSQTRHSDLRVGVIRSNPAIRGRSKSFPGFL